MHISTRLILGGSQENTVLSCEGQHRHGHNVALVFGPIYGPEGSLLDRVQKCGIEAIETPNLIRELHAIKDWKSLRDLRQLIRRWKPEVVHTHSSKAGILGRLAAWRENVPAVIHTVHGPPFHRYEKRWRNAVYELSERFAARRCHRIVCVAEAMRDQYLARGIGRPEQYEIVYSGMEIDPYLIDPGDRDATRSELGLVKDDFVIGTVARLAELKGHDDVLDAIAPIVKTYPQLKLLWVGDGWWRDRLLNRADALGVRDRIVMTGLVQPSDIPRLMRAMDAVVHPSYREGLPRSVVQAMLSAKPVIAYDVDGTKEVCINDRTGIVLAAPRSGRPSAEDTARLREAIVRVMTRRDDTGRLAEQARDFARQRFDASVMVRELERIYEGELNARRETSGNAVKESNGG